MSPGAHFPPKQFSQQILQRTRSPTAGPGRRAVPVMDAQDIRAKPRPDGGRESTDKEKGWRGRGKERQRKESGKMQPR